ncbi:hypothetical protein IMSHALPRED_001349 [Imshaugia aleurites]|uniref:Uncharacterized protein n=1 Tax=Imshaugia aleurites TaxID=172621 RepID=A0A8H3J2D4_9LECA|nr:hypothetical protein IMSHALPRED_001349 [Imshaugia aleurites]
MQTTISFLSLLAASAVASPVSETVSDLSSRTLASISSDPFLAACQRATNCETYTDPSGLQRIRFKAGMEPGSDDYDKRVGNLAKRDTTDAPGYPKTQVTVGDATLWWGCGVDPVQTINNLSSICATSGECVSNSPWTLPIEYVTPDSDPEQSATLTLTATGGYPSWLRNGLVGAMQQAAGAKGLITWDRGQSFGSNDITGKRDTGPEDDPTDYTDGPEGKCDVASFTSYFGLQILQDADTIIGHIDMVASVPDLQSGLCAALGGVTALTGAVASMFPEGAPYAGILGAITAGCQMAPTAS